MKEKQNSGVRIQKPEWIRLRTILSFILNSDSCILYSAFLSYLIKCNIAPSLFYPSALKGNFVMKKQFVPRMALLGAVVVALAMMVMPMASHAGGAAQRAEFMVVNNSDFDIHQLFLSPTHKDTWGPD